MGQAFRAHPEEYIVLMIIPILFFSEFIGFLSIKTYHNTGIIGRVIIKPFSSFLIPFSKNHYYAIKSWK
jgi:hypothetical protein